MYHTYLGSSKKHNNPYEVSYRNESIYDIADSLSFLVKNKHNATKTYYKVIYVPIYYRYNFSTSLYLLKFISNNINDMYNRKYDHIILLETVGYHGTVTYYDVFHLPTDSDILENSGVDITCDGTFESSYLIKVSNDYGGIYYDTFNKYFKLSRKALVPLYKVELYSQRDTIVNDLRVTNRVQRDRVGKIKDLTRTFSASFIDTYYRAQHIIDTLSTDGSYSFTEYEQYRATEDTMYLINTFSEKEYNKLFSIPRK
ncbi:MAG: hypothetical protein Kapaf2KO_00090 [Candidatus Kapaibacteriales bacterium]